MTSNSGAPEAFIYDAVRTPRGKGKPGGSLHTVKPVSLLSGLIEAILERNPGLDPARINDVIAGCVTPVGDQGMDIARTAALNAGLPYSATGLQVNRYCASGLTALNLAAQKVRSGWDELVFAGGVESMSRVPMGSDGGALALDPESNFYNDFIPQGISADIIASLDGMTREDLDAFAARSHERAAKAWEEGRFDRTVVPVKDQNGQVLLDRDETIRQGTTVESLSGLRPAFAMIGDQGGFDAVAQTKYPQLERINHLHHAGNSSGIVDGAALLAIGSEKAGQEMDLEPRARVVSVATTGVEPTIMLTAPAPASRAALAKAGLKPEDIDVWEINEAFSSVVLRAQRELNIPDEKLNISGGAIAMGHPLGATGAIITGNAVDELHRTGGRYALITLCVAAGMGVATIIERV
ncbi:MULTISPECIES: acetyl-CoA C-acetyltransferase [Corynebacterium]|uniref:Acetyl-CoA C-acetyltransferase n=3 Tax=Corynebacterium TaxID=1716 RepID=A0A2W5B3E3_9CORY|nr:MULTISPECIES: acetyl-CoA C-acetyltransferase [Corynebacterium]HJD50120.1 acetyl-CoA C-acetyltransferase [Candidatus Corynebacterium intestinavium]MDK7134832.1 acetyl-CoA C-acetyltransferase [Corynebacterium sp. UMB4614]MDK8791031.1 acetyl-CoA C-acetyltransferase [Corynebacterium sp. MSK039]OFO15291.1 acetyl-CoA acetyltransferase [Corynebacterium sp. HMSC22B11]PZP01181.1 MAG: acetyl-CoA C-acetyltransferase [Corynebacterium urealyticum]